MHKSLILGARMRNKAEKVVELEESIKELNKRSELEAKKLEQALKIKVTREALTLDNEVYNWNDYNISTMAGRINITDKAGNKILHLSDKALIHNTNLLEKVSLIDRENSEI